MSRKLHIGGTIKTPGWEVLNILPGEHVDHMGDASDMTVFDNDTFAAIYASHVLEHLDYVEELERSLKEWLRVLEPEGKVYISVPDMDTLARLYLDKDRISFEQRFLIMRMMFGGHTDNYDYHVVGFNEELLFYYLQAIGFVNIQRVDSFGMFEDSSLIEMEGTPISLNVIAQKGA